MAHRITLFDVPPELREEVRALGFQQILRSNSFTIVRSSKKAVAFLIKKAQRLGLHGRATKIIAQPRNDTAFGGPLNAKPIASSWRIKKKRR